MRGLDQPGPGVMVSRITAKFERAGIMFDTHAEVDRTSVSFDDFNPC